MDDRNRRRRPPRKRTSGPDRRTPRPREHVEDNVTAAFEIQDMEISEDAVKKFTDLGLSRDAALGAVRAGYKEPTEIQAKAIGPAMEGRDIIGCSETGSGKTGSFVLPLLDRIDYDAEQVQVLVLVPTRELCRQVAHSFKTLGAGPSLRVIEIYGGVGYERQRKGISEHPQVVVGAPGRVLDLLQSRSLYLNKISTLIIDEADRMLDMGFMPQIREILRFLPKKRQTLMYSATIPAEVSRFASVSTKDAENILVGARSRPPSQVIQEAYDLMPNEKDAKLLEVVRAETGTVLVFAATKARVDAVYHLLKQDGQKVCVIHSDRAQKEREKAIDGFKAGKYRIMAATDVAQRGLDIEGISLIVNYDLPHDPDDYVHRIGRTGRAQAAGRAVSFVTYQDYSTLKIIEKVIGHRFKNLGTPARNKNGRPATRLKRKVR